MTLSTTASLISSSPTQIQVNVTSSPVISDLIQIYRVHADGSQYRVLTVGQAQIISSWSGIDYHAPSNQAVKYYATTSTLTSPQSGSVTSPSTKLWLIHQSNPALSVLATKWVVNDANAYKYADRSTKFQVIGKRLPVARTDQPRGGETGLMTVKCVSPAERAAFKALLADNGTILLNTPFTSDEIGWKWVQPGELTMSNPTSYNTFGFRYAQFPYEEVEQPDVDEVPTWTFDGVTALGKTFDQLVPYYADFQSMQLNIHS